MKILIDAHMVGEKETGNETYIVNLINSLVAVAGNDVSIIALVAHEKAARNKIKLREKDKFEIVSSSSIRRILKEIPEIAKRTKADLLHVTYFPPLYCPCKLTATIHDVSFRVNPAWFSPKDRFVLNLGVGMAIKKAYHLITVSDFSKNEICRHFGVREERIHVTHNGCSFNKKINSKTLKLESIAPSIKKPYILAVGNLQPRKNISRLIKAYSEATRTGIKHYLVLVGKSAWKGSDIVDLIRRERIEERVILTGYIDDETLACLYLGADALVYPSLYEGFGLPALDAMTMGTPVITSNCASLPEIVGNAALLVDPNDTKAITEAILNLLNSQELRKDLIAKGYSQASKFSWEKTAQKTLAIYQEITR